MLNGRCASVDPRDPAAFACLRSVGHSGPHRAGSAQWTDDFTQRADLIGADEATELDQSLNRFFESICPLVGRDWVRMTPGERRNALSRARRGDINDALPERVASLVNELVSARERTL